MNDYLLWNGCRWILWFFGFCAKLNTLHLSLSDISVTACQEQYCTVSNPAKSHPVVRLQISKAQNLTSVKTNWSIWWRCVCVYVEYDDCTQLWNWTTVHSRLKPCEYPAKWTNTVQPRHGTVCGKACEYLFYLPLMIIADIFRMTCWCILLWITYSIDVSLHVTCFATHSYSMSINSWLCSFKS